MERENQRQRIFSRRAALMLGGKLALSAGLIGRMYQLQVLESEQYRLLAEDNRISLRLLPPQRGRVLDRFGVELANSRQNYRVLLVPEQAGSVEAALDRLAEFVDLHEQQRRRILKEAQRQRSFMPVVVAENLDWDAFAAINANIADLPGVHPDVGESRHYPHGAALSHVVGYVAAVAEAEQTGDPLLELPGFRVGKNGVEKTFDERLRGRAGSSRVEVNAYGRVIRELQRREGQPGADVTVTIDYEVQRYLVERLGEESASCVVMDVETGEVLALVSNPAYDPNAFNVGLSGKAWRELATHPRTPLSNKAIAGQYPPGSTFKVIVALAALEAGLVQPGATVGCRGATVFGDHTYHCWKWRYGGHGQVDMRRAIAESCDVYFYEMGRRLGVDRISEMGRRFGLGQLLDIGLTSERAGLMPTREWKQKALKQPWTPGENLIVAIGQGYMLATPLQLAVMTARLATGLAVKPRLVRDGRAAPKWPSIGVQPANLRIVLDGMYQVVNAPNGTARKARPEVPASMAGKTGTSQVRRISSGERQRGLRKLHEKPWEEREHGLFVAYAPAEQPRYAVSLIVEHGGSGAQTALIAKDIVEMLLRRDPSQLPAVPVRVAGLDR
ncbi:MAG: penicillin-binding protein 2 [Alphaproteobacteria bacterium]|nr:penicillin-binding protein 2 [Alphaproteobacteria bacterium]